MCNKCYLKGSVSKRKRNLDDCRKKNGCDHDCLILFADSLYFQQSYMERIREEKKRTPSKCIKCNKWLTNKIVSV